MKNIIAAITIGLFVTVSNVNAGKNSAGNFQYKQNQGQSFSNKSGNKAKTRKCKKRQSKSDKSGAKLYDCLVSG